MFVRKFFVSLMFFRPRLKIFCELLLTNNYLFLSSHNTTEQILQPRVKYKNHMLNK